MQGLCNSRKTDILHADEIPTTPAHWRSAICASEDYFDSYLHTRCCCTGVGFLSASQLAALISAAHERRLERGLLHPATVRASATRTHSPHKPRAAARAHAFLPAAQLVHARSQACWRTLSDVHRAEATHVQARPRAPEPAAQQRTLRLPRTTNHAQLDVSLTCAQQRQQRAAHQRPRGRATRRIRGDDAARPDTPGYASTATDASGDAAQSSVDRASTYTALELPFV